LGRPFQVRGALKARVSDADAQTALRSLARDVGQVWVSGIGLTRLREARPVSGGLALAFQGVYTPERARDLVHQSVWCSAASLPEPADDETVAVERLEGAPVTVEGEAYGRVAYVVTGAQDLLVVAGPDGERWVPWSAPYVTWDGDTVDLVDPPPGLLDPDEATVVTPSGDDDTADAD
jgi:16S rRNA processing protein RimM